MSDPAPNLPRAQKSLPETLTEWKELIALIGLALTTVIGLIFGRNYSYVKEISSILAVVLFLLGALLIRRIRQRRAEQRRREKLWTERDSLQNQRTAFRSLAPFEEQDQLPGRDRINEARIIATRITSGDFRFGVLCGESGCGKTSLLRSEVTRRLKNSGMEVVYIRSLRRLESASTNKVKPETRLAASLEHLASYITADARVLILDQFEEWFNVYRRPQLRKQIAGFILRLIEGNPPVRVVCVVRRESLVDFHEFRTELTDPLNTLFFVKNFSVEQSMNVITECAVADGLSMDESLVSAVVTDLVEAGEVRPPELQIVCTYLAVNGSFSAPKYREAGGTAGILAGYIQEALSTCPEPEIGARLLRAVCDFPARARRNPQSLEELSAYVRAVGSASRAYSQKLTADLVHHFVLSRILVDERQNGGGGFSLVHDYLVDAVQLATSGTSTQTEEANDLLRYYLKEKRGIIPFRKLLFIRASADRRNLSDVAARRLMRWSLVAPILWWSATCALAIGLAAGLFIWLNSNLTWRPEIVNSHWPQGKSGSTNYYRLLYPGKVATGWGGEADLRIWDTQTGKPWNIRNEDRSTPIEGPGGRFLLLPHGTDGIAHLLDLKALVEVTLPYTDRADTFVFSTSEKWLMWNNGLRALPSAPPLPGQAAQPVANSPRSSVYIYSLDKLGIERTLPSIRLSYPEASDVSWDGSRLVTTENSNGRMLVQLYDTSSVKLIKTLVDLDAQEAYNGPYFVAVSANRICAAYNLPSGELITAFWDIDGNPVGNKYTTRSDQGAKLLASFSQDGSRVVLWNYYLNGNYYEPIGVVDAVERPGTSSVNARMQFAAVHTVCWSEGGGTKIWDFFKGDTLFLPAMDMTEDDRLEVSPSWQRALLKHNQIFQLWNLENHQLVATLTHKHSALSGWFTLDGSACVLLEDDGTFSLFDAENGRVIAANQPQAALMDLYYDGTCRQFLTWSAYGQLTRYAEGRYYLSHFAPSGTCNPRWSSQLALEN